MLCLFVLINAIPEDYLQNDDDVSCVTGVTGITAPSFISQDRKSDLPAFFKHAVEEAVTESKKKRSVAALYHLQDFMHASNHEPINWEELTHDHTNQAFWGPFATYIGKYARNKSEVKFSDGNSSALKKSAKSRKKQIQLLFSRIHRKAVQFQKQIFFWKLLSH